MDQSLTFAVHFARLVWLLLQQGSSPDQQKEALRGAVGASRESSVDIAVENWQLTVNGRGLPVATSESQDLAAQMTGHAVAQLLVRKDATANDILTVARALAAEPVPGGGGRALTVRLDELGVRTVWVVVDVPIPPTAPGRPTPVHSQVAIPAGTGPGAAASPVASARTGRPKRPSGLVTEESSGTYLAFAKARAPQGSLSELIAALGTAGSAAATTRLLDDIVTIVDESYRAGKASAVVDGIHAIVVGEDARTQPDQQLAFDMAVRRVNRPGMLRMVAGQLPYHGDTRAKCAAILARMGEDGADVLIEQLSAGQDRGERRVYFDALVALKAGVPALLHMLGDARWYVVRNAADLLGEMKATAADGALGELLRHDEERVRRAAAGALAKLATSKALRALHSAMRDPSPEVRLLAATGLATRKEITSSQTLTRALDTEEDDAVQKQIIVALGKVATSDAVQRLIKLAEPATGLFKRKPAALRIAAINALGEAGTPAALEALSRLCDDRDEAIRDAAAEARTRRHNA